jgi:hypothetical protein
MLFSMGTLWLATTGLQAALTPIDIKVETSAALAGSVTSTGPNSYDVVGGGTGAQRNLTTPFDGASGGDEITFGYEEITGDFDKRVRITEFVTELFNADGTPREVVEGDPLDTNARGGIMVRSSTLPYSACFKIVASNPTGDNRVNAWGRAIDAQRYSLFSRNGYAGVADALPNQWLRLQRVGNSFSFYVSADGANWVLIGHRFQEMPATTLVGLYAGSSINPAATTNPEGLLGKATVKFADYGDVSLGDTTAPQVVSAGTFDKKIIGVKFSEKVSSSTATATANYSLSQGTVTAARVGIYGDAVYLTVDGLTTDSFTVTVNNVKDTSGNTVAAASSVTGKALPWESTDIGYIQNPGSRPTPGDDPYRVGETVPISSGADPEMDVVGGGSNGWNPGDFVHFPHLKEPVAGDFDVTIKVSSYDSTANAGCCSHGGIMARAAIYLEGLENTAEGTRVPFISNETYHQNSGNAAILLDRKSNGGNYDAPAAAPWATPINGIKGYFTGMNGINSVGTPDPDSSATSARYLRLRREGNSFFLAVSFDGTQWNEFATQDTDGWPTGPLPAAVYLGFSVMTDSGAGTPPNSAYDHNGHTIDPADPLNPANTPSNALVMNESNYVAQRIQFIRNDVVVETRLSIAQAGGNTVLSWTGSGVLQSAPSVLGPWTDVDNQGNPQNLTLAGSSTYYRIRE